MGILMSLGVEAILLLLKLAKHTQKLLHKFNKSAKSENAACKNLTNYVDFHSALKQLRYSLSHFHINLMCKFSFVLKYFQSFFRFFGYFSTDDSGCHDIEHIDFVRIIVNDSNGNS